MKVFDLNLDNNFDLEIQNGDFKVSESTYNHVLLHCATMQGEWKDAPLLGVGLVQQINNSDSQSLLVELKKQLEIDGITLNKLKMNNQGIEFDGEY